jgi:putative intracellular protease/amidase
LGLQHKTSKPTLLSALPNSPEVVAALTAGADVSVVAPWQSYVLQDRELISGQNPFSDEALLKLLLPALNGKKK